MNTILTSELWLCQKLNCSRETLQHNLQLCTPVKIIQLTSQYAEYVHKTKITNITDKDINNRFAVFHSKGKTSDNRKKRAGAKWLKKELLK